MRRLADGKSESRPTRVAAKPRKTDLFLPRAAIEVTPAGAKGYLARADALTFSQALRAEIADIVFLDPPFNLGKDYGVARWLEEGDADAYEFYMKKLIREMVRVLKPGGALFLYHLPHWASRLSHELLQRARVPALDRDRNEERLRSRQQSVSSSLRPPVLHQG